MALFDLSFQKTMSNEGGFLLHEVEGDRGGQTYAGIARAFWPTWAGWALIDSGQITMQLEEAVKDFYRANFWEKIKGDSIRSQYVADTLFDFAVNTGVKAAVKTAQDVAGAARDGIVGPETLGAINQTAPEFFTARFFVEKIRFYTRICQRNRGQSKFLLGWINRAMKYV